MKKVVINYYISLLIIVNNKIMLSSHVQISQWKSINLINFCKKFYTRLKSILHIWILMHRVQQFHNQFHEKRDNIAHHHSSLNSNLPWNQFNEFFYSIDLGFFPWNQFNEFFYTTAMHIFKWFILIYYN